MAVGPNVTGWEQIMNGSLIQAAINLYTIDVGGWAIGILFIVYQFMLYIKTRNLSLCIVTGFLFSILGFSSVLLPKWSMIIIVVTLIIELGGIFYLWVFK